MDLAWAGTAAAAGFGLGLNGQRVEETTQSDAESAKIPHKDNVITDLAKVKESEDWDFCLTCSDWCR